MFSGFGSQDRAVVQRREKTGERRSAYNTFMGGVDRGDQLRGYYHRHTKSRKFYRYSKTKYPLKYTHSLSSDSYIYHFMTDVALTNSFMMFHQSHPKVTVKVFQRVLATQLVGDYCSRKSAGRISYPTRPLQLQHFPIKVATPAGGRKRGKCSWSLKKHKRSDTTCITGECSSD